MQQRELKIHSRSVRAGVCAGVCVSEGATGREGLWGCTVHNACQLFVNPSTGGCRTQNFECESEKSIQSECV